MSSETPPGDDSDAQKIIMAISAAVLVLVVTYRIGRLDAPTPEPSAPATTITAASFAPPPEKSIPEGPQGEAIRRGQLLFTKTSSNAGDFVGNGMTCASCHLDSGRQPNAAPMWAAWVSYPAYRDKNKRINTMEDRIRECFLYSMNAPASKAGTPPPYGHDIYRDLQSYFAWLATDAPWGQTLPGRGFKKLQMTSLGHDPARGAAVYAEKCASCHGAEGGGQPNTDGTFTIPPLWGTRAYNWGAGMTRLSNAAGFIKVNMPLGEGNTLTDQQAWDVAAYVNSRPRPRDPRQTGSVAETKAAFHSDDDYYGQTIDGKLLGAPIASR